MTANTKGLLAICLSATLASACQGLPEDSASRSAVVGGAAGSAVGAAVSPDDRLLGALIGGAVGAGGGYLVGARTEWIDEDREDEARSRAEEAVEEARRDPATVEDVYASTTADLNNDGFVTTDELTAMERAGLDDEAILARLRRTDQVFELTSAQEEALLDEGLSRYVVREMQRINRDYVRRSDPTVVGSRVE